MKIFLRSFYMILSTLFGSTSSHFNLPGEQIEYSSYVLIYLNYQLLPNSAGVTSANQIYSNIRGHTQRLDNRPSLIPKLLYLSLMFNTWFSLYLYPTSTDITQRDSASPVPPRQLVPECCSYFKRRGRIQEFDSFLMRTTEEVGLLY